MTLEQRLETRTGFEELGLAMAWAVSGQTLRAEARFNPRPVRAECVVGRVSPGEVFSLRFSLPLSVSFHHCSILMSHVPAALVTFTLSFSAVKVNFHILFYIVPPIHYDI